MVLGALSALDLNCWRIVESHFFGDANSGADIFNSESAVIIRGH